MFFSVLCLDRAVLGRMNCPPLSTINPTSCVKHLQLVCSENALSAPSQVLPWFLCCPIGIFCSLGGQGAAWEMPHASRERAVILVLQHKPCFVLCIPPWAAGNPWLHQVQSWRAWKLTARFYIYTTDQNHLVKTWKYLNNFLFNFSCQPRDATLLSSYSA